jgi:hypothetical protein
MLLAVVAYTGHSATALAATSAEPAGGPAVAVTATFSPDRLGAATAVSFDVKIDPPAATGPIPLADVQVSYPLSLGLATSGLGLEACEPAVLEIEGTDACPPDSKMGAGSAVVEVPFGSDIVAEHVSLDIYAAPSSDGYIHLAILAHGLHPVVAQVVLSGVLLPGLLEISIPPITGVPGVYASVVDVQATVGGRLTYYEHARGRTIAYRPRGIGLPDSCPHGGFKLGARLAFTDGQRSRAGTTVPCPALHIG